MSHEASQELT